MTENGQQSVDLSALDKAKQGAWEDREPEKDQLGMKALFRTWKEKGIHIGRPEHTVGQPRDVVIPPTNALKP